MKCPRCEHENTYGQKFCGECGARLVSICPLCSQQNPPGQKFCGECGTVLVGAATSAPPAPGQYTPQHLAERILGSRAAMEGERKQVTVLFADLKGSMELLADRDPEEARRILDPVLERMMAAVHRYEGTVNQVMGDGIMALFGAPLALEDHAVRACYAALAMQASVKRYAEESAGTLRVPVQVRVGLNSGEVVVRSFGNDLHMDYSAIGQTTHVAARMEQAAAPGSVLLASNTVKLAEGYVQVQSLGPVNVKGLGEPIEVFELTGISAARSRIQAAAPRGLTQFIGRSRELTAICDACATVGTGKGQVIGVMGEPGVGKSRLFWEFTRLHKPPGWLLAESGSVPYGKATPYLPVIDLFRAYFQIEPGEDANRVRERVSGKLLALDPQLGAGIAPMLSLLNVPVQDADWEQLDPPQRRQRILDACKRLLLRESLVQPLLLVLEDLHWIDSGTQALLDVLVEALPAAPILLLVNYRPEYQLSWASKTYCVQLRIDPLTGDGAGELLETLLGNDRSLVPLKQLVMARTEGNPLFVEESVRALAETGALAGTRGAYRLNVPLDSIRVPATVQAVFAARIDRLAVEDKRLLQTASVIGKDVPLALLRMIAEDNDAAIQRGLARLQEAELLYETRFLPDAEYTFKHTLTHEVTYESLLHERRRALHAGIAQAIEARYPDRLAEHIDQLAHHAFRGELWGRAVTYLRQCGTRALTRSAYREALTLFETALAAAEHLPDDRHRTELLVDIRFEIRGALWPMGELPRVATCLQEAQRYLQILRDPSREARLLCYLTVQYEVSGDQQRAIELGCRAVVVSAQAGDRGLEAVSSLYLGQAYYIIGDFTPAQTLLSRSIGLLQGDLISQRLGMLALPSVLARAWLAWALAETGNFDVAQEHSDQAMRIAEAVNQPWSLIFGYLARGVVGLRKGDLPKAQLNLERGLDLCRQASVPLWAPVAAAHLGYAYLLAGRGVEAYALLDEVLAMDATGGLIFGRGLRAAYASEVNLRVKRDKEAIAQAERARELSRRYGEQGHEAWALRCQAEIHAQQNQAGQAEHLYRECLARAQTLGMRPLSAHCHLGLGQLFAALGDKQKAQECLERALLRYRELGMQLWLGQTESTLAAL